jgi:N utilization substance protein A
MSKEMLNALDTLEAEKGISKEIVIDALEAALVSAYKRHYGQSQNVEVEFNEKKGDIHVYAVKEVTEEVMDSQLEVSLKDAMEINPAYEIGDTIRFEVTPKDFGRIAAQTAKQVILQRVREAERSIIYNEYSAYEKDIMQGVVERQDNRYIYVNLGKIEAVLSKQDQMPNEHYKPHDRIKVYVSRVENTSKGPQEVYDGIVEIVSSAREAGDRAKVAVRSTDPNIDPVGTCVGPKGQRVQAIVNELKGENMDIVEWDEDPAVFIANSLNPAQVEDVIFDIDNPKVCTVVVPDYQLSLAIGKRGQNARLAAKLTAHKIDIKSESDMEEFYANYDESEVEEIVTEIEEITSEVEAIETEVEDIESEAEVTVDNMIEDEENIASDQTDQ